MRLLVLLMGFLGSWTCNAAEVVHDAQAGCDKYPWDMNREWSLMLTDPFPLLSNTSADPEARLLPLDRRVRIKLHPADQVKLLAPPEAQHPPAPYAGMAPIQLPFPKRYRISSAKPLWIDVFGPNGAVKVIKLATAMGCERLVKTVVFRLENETDYWLQFSGSATQEVEVIVTLDR